MSPQTPGIGASFFSCEGSDLLLPEPSFRPDPISKYIYRHIEKKTSVLQLRQKTLSQTLARLLKRLAPHVFSGRKIIQSWLPQHIPHFWTCFRPNSVSTSTRTCSSPQRPSKANSRDRTKHTTCTQPFYEQTDKFTTKRDPSSLAKTPFTSHPSHHRRRRHQHHQHGATVNRAETTMTTMKKKKGPEPLSRHCNSAISHSSGIWR